MKKLQIPAQYQDKLSLRDTQRAIKLIKDTFQKKLAVALNLDRITAPILVTKNSGINDDLNGVERKVHFSMKEIDGTAEVVQSLAKWKRMALYRYGYSAGEGIYTDMNAIRRDDDVDNTHSIFVDQWDWERVICREERTLEFLQEVVRKIVAAFVETHELVKARFPQLTAVFQKEVTFLTSQELEDRYPGMTGKEREDAITKECGTVFIMQIGGKLRSGEKHDGRAPDYDAWALNGDLLFWNGILGRSLEISSMGIRVDEESLSRQLSLAGCDDRRELPFHKMLLNGELPLTIGGGIGQSRLCMLMMGCAHIGEVQASVWDEETVRVCAEAGVPLL